MALIDEYNYKKHQESRYDRACLKRNEWRGARFSGGQVAVADGEGLPL
jgi:hypothetical protein